MDEPLFERVETEDGAVLITTKTRFYGVLARPRTYVIPEGFGGSLGFQARYNTSDPEILSEFHRFWIERVAYGQFKTLLAEAKQGKIVLPPELAHLAQHIIGFNA
jgi:hypothetical protein